MPKMGWTFQDTKDIKGHVLASLEMELTKSMICSCFLFKTINIAPNSIVFSKFNRTFHVCIRFGNLDSTYQNVVESFEEVITDFEFLIHIPYFLSILNFFIKILKITMMMNVLVRTFITFYLLHPNVVCRSKFLLVIII